VLYNLGSGSWLAWANDTTMPYVAIHCPHQQTIGPAVQHADIPPPQSDTLGLHPIARKLLLISHPTKVGGWASVLCFWVAVKVSDILSAWPVTFSSENWHSTYSCCGERPRQFWLFYVFPVFELAACAGQTDGWGRCAMQPTGETHNNSEIKNGTSKREDQD